MATQRYTAKQVIAAIREAQGILVDAAGILGCTRMTLYNYTERYITIAKALQEQREILVDVAERKLRNKLEADEDWAIKFTLRTLGKSRGYAERQEITGAEGGPVIIGSVQLTEAQQKRALEQLAMIHAKTTGETDVPLPES